MAGNRRSSTLTWLLPVIPASWGWPGIAAQVHCGSLIGADMLSWGWPGIAAQVHSRCRPAHAARLGMAGNRRSSTLASDMSSAAMRWGWPGIAAQVHCRARWPCHDRWGWPGIAAQVHYLDNRTATRCAGDGRESPLKYTHASAARHAAALGMAGNRRSSTLMHALRSSSTAGDGRESPLKYTASTVSAEHRRWGWPGIAAQVHCRPSSAHSGIGWGWPGIAAQVHSTALPQRPSSYAGDGRESPLKYTASRRHRTFSCAGDGRESPLKYTATGRDR